jgi:hypothetical protein
MGDGDVARHVHCDQRPHRADHVGDRGVAPGEYGKVQPNLVDDGGEVNDDFGDGSAKDVVGLGSGHQSGTAHRKRDDGNRG